MLKTSWFCCCCSDTQESSSSNLSSGLLGNNQASQPRTSNTPTRSNNNNDDNDVLLQQHRTKRHQTQIQPRLRPYQNQSADYYNHEDISPPTVTAIIARSAHQHNFGNIILPKKLIARAQDDQDDEILPRTGRAVITTHAYQQAIPIAQLTLSPRRKPIISFQDL